MEQFELERLPAIQSHKTGYDGESGSDQEPQTDRKRLLNKFEAKLSVSDHLTRQMISYQGNKHVPGFRWMKYKEAFSSQLVKDLLGNTNARTVLDPFSGSGTTALTAGSLAKTAIGMDVLPVGNSIAQAILAIANLHDSLQFDEVASELLDAIEFGSFDREHCFQHIPITSMAFPDETEEALARANQFIAQLIDQDIAFLLRFACLSVLEDVSYTRKDGQFLRWDLRSGRQVSTRLNKGPLPSLKEALKQRLVCMKADYRRLRERYRGVSVEIIEASCLDELQNMPSDWIDAVLTSPPYANRYDYTRTYALELAFLGYDAESVKKLRQSLLSATVENHSKQTSVESTYRNSDLPTKVIELITNQQALQEVISNLKARKQELNNRKVIDLLQNYFYELTLVVAELSRVCTQGATVFMVNDNVQYAGEEVPVDLILADIAEELGFSCERIYVLKRGKGNSSQQMGRFGRTEIRKCLYHWVRR